MDGKFLGRIEKAEFGTHSDRSYFMGLQLTFKFDGSGVSDGGRHLINVSDNCKWGDIERNEAHRKAFQDLEVYLKDAKVNYVSELVGKPIEVTIKNQQYESFRILTEVL